MRNASPEAIYLMTKVIFFGNERLVSGLPKTDAPILTGLIKNGYDVVAVVSHFSDTQSRNNRELEVAAIAKEHNIPLFIPHKPSEIIDELRAFKADVAVLAAYGRIVSQAIIDLFPLGIINIHPSLLPRYRGPTPIESAILNGDDETGVSIMQLSAGMDEGPVYAQSKIPLNGTESKFELYSRIVEVTNTLFFDTFTHIIDSSIQATPQADEGISYSHLIHKQDGVIDWSAPAVTIDRQIRAYEGWPQSRTTINSLDVIITKAHVTTGDSRPGTIVVKDGRELLIGTGKDLISIDSIKPLGKKEMPIAAFLAGYKSHLVTN